MTVVGYILAIVIGLLLGLLGGGGSILSVPVLKYAFDYSADDATAYSLFVVGTASLMGVASYLKEKRVDFKVLFTFGLLASVSAFLNRKYFIPNIPDELLTLGSITITKDFFIMVLFSVMMFLSAKSMIKNAEHKEGENNHSIYKLLFMGVLVGLFTSLVGAGGGFIVVPILVKFYGMPIKNAIGTSLGVIMINSLSGFVGEVMVEDHMDWKFLVLFSGLASLGILFGVYFSNKISSKKLKPTFGWFVAAMSVLIVLKEIFDL